MGLVHEKRKDDPQIDADDFAGAINETVRRLASKAEAKIGSSVLKDVIGAVLHPEDHEERADPISMMKGFVEVATALSGSSREDLKLAQERAERAEQRAAELQQGAAKNDAGLFTALATMFTGVLQSQQQQFQMTLEMMRSFQQQNQAPSGDGVEKQMAQMMMQVLLKRLDEERSVESELNRLGNVVQALKGLGLFGQSANPNGASSSAGLLSLDPENFARYLELERLRLERELEERKFRIQTEAEVKRMEGLEKIANSIPQLIELVKANPKAPAGDRAPAASSASPNVTQVACPSCRGQIYIENPPPKEVVCPHCEARMALEVEGSTKASEETQAVQGQVSSSSEPELSILDI